MAYAEKNLIDKLQDEIRNKKDKQMEGLRRAFEISFWKYWDDHSEYPNLNNDQDVNLYLEGRPDLKAAVFKLDLVLPRVKEIAFEILENLRKTGVRKGAKKK